MARLPVNEDFFKIWSPEMAYVLGFFCADGTMTVNPRGSKYIDFDIGDKDLLLKIKKCLNAGHPIKERRRHNSMTYRLQIGSKALFDDLVTLGFTPKKTFRFSMPVIPEGLLKHFVRGYFDGDGNIWKGLIHKERRFPFLILSAAFTSGNKEFLIQLAHCLEYTLSIKGSLRYSGGAYRLVYATKSSLFLYRFMYTGMENNLFLDRKKAVFEKYISDAAVV